MGPSEMSLKVSRTICSHVSEVQSNRLLSISSEQQNLSMLELEKQGTASAVDQTR